MNGVSETLPFSTRSGEARKLERIERKNRIERKKREKKRATFYLFRSYYVTR
jgi:hypothetical protein